MSMQINTSGELAAGDTIQRIEDNETRKVAEVERDADGVITRVVLVNKGGLYGDPDTLDADEITGWVIL